MRAQWADWLGTVAELVVIVFVLEIIVPTRAFLDVQASTELITLHISDWYRVVAMLVGAGADFASSRCCALLETTDLGDFFWRSPGRAAIAGGLWLAQPLLVTMGLGSLILFFVVIVAACVFIGVPIAFTFGIATLSYLSLTTTMPLDDRHQPHG